LRDVLVYSAIRPMNHAAPIVVIALFLARSVEMAIRKGKVKGPILFRGTWWALFASGTAVVGISLTEFYFRPHLVSPACFCAGILAGGLSFALRAWAAHYLGRYWSMHIELRSDQPLVVGGPFGWVRHPIYLAAAFELTGAILLLQSWWGVAAALVLFVPAVACRIVLEERAMIAHFGDAYSTYMTTTPAIVPWRVPQRKGPV
jgi:protein-S-isoprenylcysteine O-methyltransferase Ste14